MGCVYMRCKILRKVSFGFLFLALLLPHLVILEFNLLNNISNNLNTNPPIRTRDATDSVVFDEMSYEWTGSWGIVGLGSFGWSGYARYTYIGGKDFSVDYYDDYFGDADYSINNATR